MLGLIPRRSRHLEVHHVLLVESAPPKFPGVALALREQGLMLTSLSDTLSELPSEIGLEDVAALVINTSLAGRALEDLMRRIRARAPALPTLALMHGKARRPVVKPADAYLYEPFTVE